MKNTMFLIAVSAAALSLGACKKDTPAATGPDAGLTAAASDSAMATPPAAASPAQAFADAAAASDAFEIESSRLAATKSQSAKVKRFAEQMIKAHTDSTAKLKTAAGAASPAITPSPTLNATQQQALTDLGSKSGADFDVAYAKAQTDGHQQTLDTMKAYSSAGTVPSLKSFAAELVPIVTAHLNMAKGL